MKINHVKIAQLNCDLFLEHIIKLYILLVEITRCSFQIIKEKGKAILL